MHSNRWRRTIGYLCAVLTAGGISKATAQELIAWDSAADPVYDGSWCDRQEGGGGWTTPWMLWTRDTGSCGYFLQTSTSNGDGDRTGDGDIDTNGRAWGLFARDGVTAWALRGFAPLTPWDTLCLSMDNGWIDGDGVVGMGLQTSDYQNRVEFYFVAGMAHYILHDGDGPRDTGIPFTDEGLRLLFSIVDGQRYILTVIERETGIARTFSGRLSGEANAAIELVRFFNYNANAFGADGAPRDLYVNSLALYTMRPDADERAPQIELLGSSMVTIECGTAFADPGARAFDDMDGDLSDRIATSSDLNVRRPGAYTVTYRVADAAGNEGVATRTVRVVDTIAPTLSRVSDQTVVPSTSAVLAPVFFRAPTATDNSDSVSVVCVPAPGSFLAPGAHTVTCTATDSSGNRSQFVFRVTVLPFLRVAFQAPIQDDNKADDIEKDADQANLFRVGVPMPHIVKLYDCKGRDVTAAVAPLVKLQLNVTEREQRGAGSVQVADPPEKASVVGGAKGAMAPVGDTFQFNLDTQTFEAGTQNNARFFRSLVRAAYVAVPGVFFEEDAMLESR
ncbi:MAG TPA: DUF5011 domain-containing protein [Kiritimatiellia bacterium]|nr:DUF5011 domain-containing protein [Kiritimatiellia bacterium]HRZ11221.1 DUF5011 domain-containing protein [Kiritimatiellia bacterium]HSA19072.1 DUF5011 domain-containing protein [Kiritimatiellia bacterium]